MTDKPKRSDLERTEELFAFLQGKLPKGFVVPAKEHPKLTADQAWTVIWFLGNQYWQVSDHIERCDVCGDLYDSDSEGDCLDYGKAPYSFCDGCMTGSEYRTKEAKR